MQEKNKQRTQSGSATERSRMRLGKDVLHQQAWVAGTTGHLLFFKPYTKHTIFSHTYEIIQERGTYAKTQKVSPNNSHL